MLKRTLVYFRWFWSGQDRTSDNFFKWNLLISPKLFPSLPRPNCAIGNLPHVNKTGWLKQNPRSDTDRNKCCHYHLPTWQALNTGIYHIPESNMYPSNKLVMKQPFSLMVKISLSQPCSHLCLSLPSHSLFSWQGYWAIVRTNVLSVFPLTLSHKTMPTILSLLLLHRSDFITKNKSF